MAKIKNFEEHYNSYEEWFKKNSLIFEDELNVAKELIGSEVNGLEVGIGSGQFAIPLGISIGIEPSKEMRKLAQAKGLNSVEGIGENLPFNDDKFNFLFINTTICFFDNPLKALKEAYRVIKQDGFIVIGFVDKNSKLGREYQRKKSKSKFYSEAIFFSKDEVLALSKKAGFTNCIYKSVSSTENSFVFIKCFKANFSKRKRQ